MKLDDSFHNRIAIARNALGLTQSQLAEKVGVVRRQIAAYEAGSSKPRDGVLKNLAAALGTTSDWLANGRGEGPDISAIQRTITVREIPVYKHAHKSKEVGVPLYSGISPTDFIPAPPHAGENSFAVQIDGDSMVSSSGISFPEGYLVCFDPDIPVQSGDFVLCTYDGSHTFFKQLIRDQGRNYLKSLNPRYQLQEIDDELSIMAVAIHAQIDLTKSFNHTNYPWDSIEAWGEKDVIDEKASLYLKLEEIEEKLNALLDNRANKKPT